MDADPSDPTVPGPLAGVRVLDLTRGMPGALTTMYLADYGAEVVMVEPPSGAALRRTHGHSVWNRGKRSLVVDLDADAGRALVGDLAAGADVVVEDHRPGRLAARSLGYEDVARADADVVYCSISAYGQTGSRRDRLGYDAAVAAHLGIMVEWGGHREGPIFLGHPSICYATAFLAVIGTLAALRARLAGGGGDHLDVSLLDGALALYPMNWWSERHAASMDEKSASGNIRFGHKRLLLRMYECSDGELIQVHTGAAGAFDRAMEVFGLGGEVSKMQGAVQMASLLTDRDLEILETRMPDIMRTKSRQEWLELLWANQVAALPVGRPGEALDDDQVRYAGIVAALDDPDLGPIEVVGPSIVLSATPGAIGGPAPTLDADGPAFGSVAGASAGLEPARHRRSLATPLDGIRIVEFSTFFAAPYGDRLLSGLGAEVIKVEGLDGDPMRPLPEIFEGANWGKRGIAANLKHPEAATLVRRLDRHGRRRPAQPSPRRGRAARHRCRDRARRPSRRHLPTRSRIRLVGPEVDRSRASPRCCPASSASSPSVLARATGRTARSATRTTTTDWSVPARACWPSSTASAPAVVSTSRAPSCTPRSSRRPSTTSATGRYESVIPRLDHELYGWTAGYRIYQCLDAWICVTCVNDEQLAALAEAVLPDSAARPSAGELTATAPSVGPLAELLEYHFVEATVDDWVERLARVGVPAEAVRETSWMASELFHDEEMVRTRRIAAVDHPVYGPVRVIDRLVRPTRHETPVRGRAPLVGEDTVEVLTAIGYSPDEIDDLLRRAAIAAVEPATATT